MANGAVDADFCVSWLLGLQSKPSFSRPPSHDYTSEDPDFSVTWLLGISWYQTLEEEIAIWVQENTSDDPQFRVSWLLGLEPQPGRCWGWAAQYETDHPEFLGVSHILGLTPVPEAPCEEVTNETSDSEEDEDGEAGAEILDEEDELGLLRLFGELAWVTDDSEESGSETDSVVEEEDPPVLATPEFLQLCAQMDEMLSELEYVLSRLARITVAETDTEQSTSPGRGRVGDGIYRRCLARRSRRRIALPEGMAPPQDRGVCV